MSKFFNIINFVLVCAVIVFSINEILTGCHCTNAFLFIFTVIGLSNVFSGIQLLNNNKQILSCINFSLSAFLFISAAIKLCL